MGRIAQPAPVKLFTGVLTARRELLPALERSLEDEFGPLDARSEIFPFDATRYYEREMGAPLLRCFYGFAALIDPARLPEVKVTTNRLEAEVAHNEGAPRPANIDPGYLEQSKLVLASTKNFYHRILLGRGIYAEVTLHYEGGAWRPFPWTFPDFRSGRYDPFFTELRDRYRRQLRSGNPAPEA